MKSHFFFFVFCAAFFSACLAEERVCMADVNPLGWESAVTVEYANGDSVALHDLALVVRYGRDAKPGIIPIRIETITPDSLAAADTVLLRIPAPEVRSADFLEAEQSYRTHVRLSRKGIYRFRFEPAEERPVKDIRAIGIEIKKHHGKE